MLDDKEAAIRYLSIELGMSDKNIAKLFEVTRSSIAHFRRHHGIFKQDSIGRKGELAVLRRLNKLGFRARDMNEIDKSYPYDVLVNQKIKIEVKTATLSDDKRFVFALSDKPSNGNIESENRIVLPSGRTRKLYERTADYFVLVGIDEDGLDFWIMPTNAIAKNQYCITCTNNSHKYEKYKNNFDILRSELNDSNITSDNTNTRNTRNNF